MVLKMFIFKLYGVIISLINIMFVSVFLIYSNSASLVQNYVCSVYMYIHIMH